MSARRRYPAQRYTRRPHIISAEYRLAFAAIGRLLSWAFVLGFVAAVLLMHGGR